MLQRAGLFVLLISFSVAALAQAPAEAKPEAAPATTLEQDEYAVYAVGISGLFDNAAFKERKLLIDNRTVSFECGADSCNSLDVGNGCSGMRQPGQNPDDVAALFHQTMTLLEPQAWSDFKKKNEHCSTLQNEFPLQRDYLWMEDSSKQVMVGKRPASELSEAQQAEWAQPDKVFLSRPGFNADRNQALLYLGVVCHENCSWFGYLMMAKVNGTWTAVGHQTMAGH